MPTYITLIKLTSQGHHQHQGGPARLDAGKDQLKVFGSELKASYLTMGRHDVVAIRAPDDDAAAKVALAIGSAGNASTETLRGFTEEEYREIVAALPQPVSLTEIFSTFRRPAGSPRRDWSSGSASASGSPRTVRCCCSPRCSVPVTHARP